MSKQFIIFNLSEVNAIDFSEVYETDASTLRFSLDKNLTFVKTNLSSPGFLEALSSYEILSETEMKKRLNQYPWSIPAPYPNGSVEASNPLYEWDSSTTSWQTVS